MVVAKVQAKFKEIETQVKEWMQKQPAAIEVAVITAATSVQGALIGGGMGMLTGDMASTAPMGLPMTPEVQATTSKLKAIAASPWNQARNFAVMTGVNAGITAALRRTRGVEDVQSSMAAAFGSGVAFSLVSGMGGPNPAANALSSGIAFAVVQGAIFQLGQQFGGGASQEEDRSYFHTKGMLGRLGLTKYEKNFKKGMLNDRTLPLLNDRALQEVKIPPGPRLLILDHIKTSLPYDE
eukprot:TRINITY_DN24060_c0_g1_i1.p1 TRINITY_DN24060_c0_g1~~TRINITY_DN24060_c0_g1_i1.p1  ORF type:complete len:238 (+),score=52.96 TRINITY_DN24060_c0_g1_i1:144-857(+)